MSTPDEATRRAAELRQVIEERDAALARIAELERDRDRLDKLARAIADAGEVMLIAFSAVGTVRVWDAVQDRELSMADNLRAAIDALEGPK